MFNLILVCAFAVLLMLTVPVFGQTAPDRNPNLQRQAAGSGGGFVPATVHASLRQPVG